MLSIGCGEVVHCFPSELPILILVMSILVMSGLDMSKCPSVCFHIHITSIIGFMFLAHGVFMHVYFRM